MSALSVVLGALGDAWSRRRVFVGLYLFLRLLTYAVLAPVVGLLINLAVSLSSQTALTDQDIAGFILTPGGFAATITVLSVFTAVEVLGFAIMTAIWRAGGADRISTARTAILAVLKRARPLLVFTGLFVLRVLALSVPFVLLGLLVALFFLSEYDINYYLTYHPPEAFMAAAIIAVLLLALAFLLLSRLTSWALALHLVLFKETRPWSAFGESAALTHGKSWQMQRAVVAWLLVRFGLLAIIGLCAGMILNLVPIRIESGLKLVLAFTLAVSALWGLAGLVVSALALGALARIIDGFFDQNIPIVPISTRPGQGPKRRLTLIGLGSVALMGFGFWSGAQLLDGIATEDQVQIIAHRGAAGSRPENTLASVEKAIEDGADWVEIDVQEIADGQVVVAHDSDFMKLAGVDLKIWDATMEDIAEIDIGSWFDAAYADQRTPLLADVLNMARDRARVLIELKYYGHNDRLERRVVQIVEDLNMQDQIATMSLKYPLVQEMLALRSNWPAGVLAATSVGDLAGLDGDFVALSSGQASSWLASSINAAGKDLFVWTVNDPLDMSKMISMGVDGLITDEPELARQVLAFRAQLSTPERLLLWMSEELGVTQDGKGYRDASP